jgi:hypothetical protein
MGKSVVFCGIFFSCLGLAGLSHADYRADKLPKNLGNTLSSTMNPGCNDGLPDGAVCKKITCAGGGVLKHVSVRTEDGYRVVEGWCHGENGYYVSTSAVTSSSASLVCWRPGAGTKRQSDVYVYTDRVVAEVDTVTFPCK